MNSKSKIINDNGLPTEINTQLVVINKLDYL